MKQDNLRTLLVEELADLYDAERQIIDALPKMISAANSNQLKRGLEEHLRATQKQIDRLDQVFDHMGVQRESKSCEGMRGIIREGEKHMQMGHSPEVLDAAIISSAQKVEHYEIAGYGTARTYARMLGEMETAQLLEKTLDEEGQTDQKLTELAEYHVNPRAAGQ